MDSFEPPVRIDLVKFLRYFLCSKFLHPVLESERCTSGRSKTESKTKRITKFDYFLLLFSASTLFIAASVKVKKGERPKKMILGGGNIGSSKLALRSKKQLRRVFTLPLKRSLWNILNWNILTVEKVAESSRNDSAFNVGG